MNEVLYNAYVKILKEELLPAMGCTEPIAVAYAAALVRKTLGTIPQSAEVHVSANIIKNVKSVVVPHTGGMRGIDAAVAAGIIAGNADRELEVLSDVNEEEVRIMAHYLKQTPISIAASDNGYIFDIQIRANAGEHTAFVRIAGSHTNVIRVEKDGTVLRDLKYEEGGRAEETDRSLLNVENIIEFADCVDIKDVKAVLDRQIDFNVAIAEEGLSRKWGANVGRVLLNAYGNDVASCHQLRKRQPGNDSLPARYRLRKGTEGITISTLPGAGCVQSGDHPSQNRHWPSLRLLRRYQRRLRRRCWNHLSLWR